MRPVRTVAAACGLLLFLAAPVVAQQTIFVVRHAERAESAPAPGTSAMMAPATDPPLSAAGLERAARLAAMLRSANISHVYATEFIRTRQTVAPLAQAQHLEVTEVPAKDTARLVEQVRAARGNVLIAGHSNTVPDLLKALGIKDDIAIPDGEFDNLFIVVQPATGEPTLVRLRY